MKIIRENIQSIQNMIYSSQFLEIKILIKVSVQILFVNSCVTVGNGDKSLYFNNCWAIKTKCASHRV